MHYCCSDALFIGFSCDSRRYKGRFDLLLTFHYLTSFAWSFYCITGTCVLHLASYRVRSLNIHIEYSVRLGCFCKLFEHSHSLAK